MASRGNSWAKPPQRDRIWPVQKVQGGWEDGSVVGAKERGGEALSGQRPDLRTLPTTVRSLDFVLSAVRSQERSLNREHSRTVHLNRSDPPIPAYLTILTRGRSGCYRNPVR